MSIITRLTKSLDSQNLKEFSELINIPALFINDIYDLGLLHHMLAKYPELPIEFYKAIIENSNTNLNLSSSSRLPPLLSTKRDDIIELLLSVPACNINITFGKDRQQSIVTYVIENDNLELLDKLIKTGRLELAQISNVVIENMAPINYAMSKSMKAFKLIQNHINLCNQNIGKHNPVEYAVKHSNVEAFELLLNQGCSLNINILEGIIVSNNGDMMAVFIKYLYRSPNKPAILKRAIETNNVALFREVSKFVRDIAPSIIQENLEKTEVMVEIIKLANEKGENDIIRSLFIGIVQSRNPKYFSLLGNIKMDKHIVSEIIYQLVSFKKLDELEALILNTNILEEVIGDILSDNIELLSALINAGKLASVKKIVEEYDLKLNGKPIKIDEFIRNDQYDILLQLLTKYTIVLRDDRIIYKLINTHHYELVLLLINKYRMVPKEKDTVQHLINTNADEVLLAILRTEPRVLGNVVNVNNFIKLLDIIGDDRELLERFIDASQNIKMYKMFTDKSQLLRLLEHPNYVLKIVDDVTILQNYLFEAVNERDRDDEYWDEERADEDDAEYVIFELLKILNAEQRNEIMNTIRSIDRAYDKFLSLNPILRVIDSEDNDLIRYLLTFLRDDLGYVSLRVLLNKDKSGTLENIDQILALPEISVTSAIPKLMSLIDRPKYYELLRRSNVIDKVIDHPNVELNELIYENPDNHDDKQLSILDFVVQDVTEDDNSVKNWRNDERLRILRRVLSKPNVDVNIENEYGDTTIFYVIDSITSFEDVDYEAGETYSYPHAVLKILMNHPSFNVNTNRKIFTELISNDSNLQYLFTTLISRPDCDVNYCRLIHTACNNKNINILRILLTLQTLDVNQIAIDEDDGSSVTPMHIAIKEKFVEGVRLLLEDPRLDLTITDSKGRNYSRLAAKTGMREIVALLATRGLTDDKQARIERETAEYEARMAEMGRVKQSRIRETLNSFDLILKERERPTEVGTDITAYSRSLCPFCLTYLEKDSPDECVYLYGHVCPAELQNEPLKRAYFGDAWETKVFQICCTCGRPAENHGHFTKVRLNEGVSVLARNDDMANNWACNEHNGGGGKLEMVIRLLSMLTELKHRVDNNERLVYGPELIRELAVVANNSLFNESIRDRAIAVFERRKWNVNSKIPKYAKFNAPISAASANANASANATASANASANATAVRREEIVHFANPEQNLKCAICLDDSADDLFKPHEVDEGFICIDCLKRIVCSSVHVSVSCPLCPRSLTHKKQIFKEDVNNLLGRNNCEGVAVVVPGDD